MFSLLVYLKDLSKRILTLIFLIFIMLKLSSMFSILSTDIQFVDDYKRYQKLAHTFSRATFDIEFIIKRVLYVQLLAV